MCCPEQNKNGIHVRKACQSRISRLPVRSRISRQSHLTSKKYNASIVRRKIHTDQLKTTTPGVISKTTVSENGKSSGMGTILNANMNWMMRTEKKSKLMHENDINARRCSSSSSNSNSNSRSIRRYAVPQTCHSAESAESAEKLRSSEDLFDSAEHR